MWLYKSLRVLADFSHRYHCYLHQRRKLIKLEGDSYSGVEDGYSYNYGLCRGKQRCASQSRMMRFKVTEVQSAGADCNENANPEDRPLKPPTSRPWFAKSWKVVGTPPGSAGSDWNLVFFWPLVVSRASRRVEEKLHFLTIIVIAPDSLQCSAPRCCLEWQGNQARTRSAMQGDYSRRLHGVLRQTMECMTFSNAHHGISSRACRIPLLQKAEGAPCCFVKEVLTRRDRLAPSLSW